MNATAINVTMLDGNEYLFCEDEGFSSESLVKFLKEQLGSEFEWIETIKAESHGWDITTLNLQEVLDEVYKENNNV